MATEVPGASDTMARDMPGMSTIGILRMGVTMEILVLVALVAPAVLGIVIEGELITFWAAAGSMVPKVRLRAAAMANLLEVAAIRTVFSSLRSDTAPSGAGLSWPTSRYAKRRDGGVTAVTKQS